MMNSNFVRLLDRKIGGLGAFQDLVHVGSGAPVQVDNVHAVGHKPAVFDKFSVGVYRREPVFCREVYNLCSLRNEDGARQHEDSVSPPLACGSKCSLNILGI